MKRLIAIQNKLKAPKNQRNNFGNYNYRSCEDILEAVKPLLTEQKVALIIRDDVTAKDGRFYIRATATLFDEEGKEIASATAYAREEETKKGMDASQLTGSTSSYARKYALNGLFAIDDTKDSDATNTHDKEEEKPETKKPNSDFVPDVLKEQKKLTVDAALEELQKYSEPSNAFNYFNSVINKVDDKKKFKDEFQAYYKKLKGEE